MLVLEPLRKIAKLGGNVKAFFIWLSASHFIYHEILLLMQKATSMA